MAEPTYGTLNLGDETTIEAETISPYALRRGEFSFPGLPGGFSRSYGSKPLTIVWRCNLRAADDAALQAVRQTIQDAMDNQTEGNYTARDGERSWTEVTIIGFKNGIRRIIRGGAQDGWIMEVGAEITFFVPVA